MRHVNDLVYIRSDLRSCRLKLPTMPAQMVILHAGQSARIQEIIDPQFDDGVHVIRNYPRYFVTDPNDSFRMIGLVTDEMLVDQTWCQKGD